MKNYDSEFERREFVAADGMKDWYLVRKGAAEKPCVVVLHGHGSCGDQLIRRKDIIEFATAYLVNEDFSVISPNYRGNSWMSEAAQSDLAQILASEKTLLKWEKLFISAGSMGGTSAMIFAMRHRELVDGVAVQGGATDPESYIDWLTRQERPVLQEIKAALQQAFPGEAELRRNSVLANFDKLKGLPLYIAHGGEDGIIPVWQVRSLRDKLQGEKCFLYEEIRDGNHDSPLEYFSKQVKWLIGQSET
ncbi:MAG: alpha/beta fold hydrolase [Lentisphaeria bacterium]|nr:alpha/beta fold hydrolase [Lentisphaeria bacterium]